MKAILTPILFSVFTTSSIAASGLSTLQSSSESSRAFYKNIGISYMSFFDGPGIMGEDQSVTPNALGRPSDDGLILMNNLSFKYNLKKDFSIDFQTRFHYVMNNGNDVEDFKAFRWQSPRLGISTTFIKTQNSKLTGALNTDLPYSFPEPIGGGYIAEQRTTILTPGLFAKYSYTPLRSKWSIFSLVQPRFYIYKNRNVAEPQLSRAGYSPQLKNEFTMSLSPSINYAFSEKLGVRIGSEAIYKKLVYSNWNPFKGTSKSADLKSRTWRLQPTPIQLGMTYSFSKMFDVSTYIQGYPIGAQRIDRSGNQATFEDTISVGAWISGVLL